MNAKPGDALYGIVLRGRQSVSSRNGLPESRPYVWRDRDAGRQAQVQAILEGIRASLEAGDLLADSFDDPYERPASVGASRSPRPPWRLKGCGTPAAYRRHLRHGEKPCEACTDAETAARHARGDSRSVRCAAQREVP